MAATRDYYEILGVDRSVSEAGLKKAYRKIALKDHPDRNKGDAAAAERFKEAAEAYAALSEPEQRRIYDQYGHDGLRGRGVAGGGVDARDIFEGLFGHGGLSDLFEGFFGGGGRRAGPRQGSHLRVGVRIPLKEAFKGTERSITIKRHEHCGECRGSGARAGTAPEICATCRGQGRVQRSQGFFMMQSPCPACRGVGQVIREPCGACRGSGVQPQTRDLGVRIPAGILSGSQLRVPGEGEPGEQGGPRGDLYCVVEVEDHPLFERDGDDLLCEMPISYPQAVLGASIDVPTLDGAAQLKIPAGTASGKVFRLRGQGMPSVYGHGRGDLLIAVQIEVPRRVSGRQKELMHELLALEEEHGSPQRKGFMDKVRELFD
jgi:molecular chaperone DnaJ